MIKPDAETKIYVYLKPVDMRKSIDGLNYLLVDQLEQNPQEKTFFVFCNKQRDKIKMLAWDKNGFVLYYKRLERGRFQYSKYLQGDKIIVNEAELKALLMGIDFYILSTHSSQDYSEFI
jgi:transposase